MLAALFALITQRADALLAAIALAQEGEVDDGLEGFTGFVADVIVELGEFGVGLLVFIETVFPPIPSEIILSLAGYLAERGRMNVGLVVVAATIGSVLGALVLYALGAWFGEERAKSWIARLPLVEMRDLDNASAWFQRHGEGVVFFGRFVPIVRSMVSLPAGAQHMRLLPFIVLTAAGSAMWNGALIGAGYALGTQYRRVEDYTQYLDYGVIAGIAGLIAWFLAPRLWRRHGPAARRARYERTRGPGS
jgi:membrane protein DedA with SNARE-associated domain